LTNAAPNARARGGWVPADREAEIRSTIADGWRIESDHFVIRTNDSLERGVELAAALEEMHRYFLRTFADFFQTPQQMKRLLDDGRPTGSTVQKHEIWYLKSRAEYAKIVRAKQPGADQMNGLYVPRDRIAYLFANSDDPQANLETMYHEVTH